MSEWTLELSTYYISANLSYIRDKLNNNILYIIITLLIIVVLLAFAFNYQSQHIHFVCQQSDIQETCRVALEP
jgi:hypothetical protein